MSDREGAAAEAAWVARQVARGPWVVLAVISTGITAVIVWQFADGFDPVAPVAALLAVIAVDLVVVAVRLRRRVLELERERVDAKAQHATFAAELQAERDAEAEARLRERERRAVTAARASEINTAEWRAAMGSIIDQARALRPRLEALDSLPPTLPSEPSDYTRLIGDYLVWLEQLQFYLEMMAASFEALRSRFGSAVDRDVLNVSWEAPRAAEVIDWAVQFWEDLNDEESR